MAPYPMRCSVMSPPSAFATGGATARTAYARQYQAAARNGRQTGGMDSRLADFLRARRAAIDPRRAGVPADARPRRVPGLRREELAALAHVSIDYVVRLEQGRTRRVF